MELFRKNEKSELVAVDTFEPNREEVPLDFIPFQFCNVEDLLPTPRKPPLYSAAELNVGMFRNSVTYETALRFIPPTAVLKQCKSETLVVGNPEKAIIIEEPEGDAKYMVYDGTGIEQLRNAMKDKKDDIASLVSRALETTMTDTEAWQTQAMRRSGEVSVVQSVAINLSLALTICLRWKMWWDGADEEQLTEVSVRLNTALSEIVIEGPKLTALVDAYLRGAMSYPTFYYNLTHAGMTRDGITAAQELEEIRTEDRSDLDGRGAERETTTEEDDEIEEQLDELEEGVSA